MDAVMRQLRAATDHKDTRGLFALLKHLRAACEDPEIVGSPDAHELAKTICNLLSAASPGMSSDEVLQPLARLADRNEKIERGKNRNAPARTWIATEWRTRTDLQQSKKGFAIAHAQLLKNKFTNLRATADTIQRWLRNIK